MVLTFANQCVKLQHVLIALSFIYLSICSSFHAKYFIIFCLHFLRFSYCFPFLETSELQKNVQELKRNLFAFRDYAVGVILNH